MTRDVFVNPAGQRDNIGDSVLRRPYLDALRRVGPLHVLVGADKDYASALGLQRGDRVYSSRLKWLAGAAFSLAFRSAVFAANAGEVLGTIDELRRSRWQVALVNAARLGGGRVVACGLSIRPGTDPRLTRVSRFSQRSALVTWRDQWSCDAVGVGEVFPDWAFAIGHGGNVRGARPYLAVSMRGDRPFPSDQWFLTVRELCNAVDLEPVIVVQVRRDHERAAELASRLQAAVIEWKPADDHATQELKLREFYRSCAGVVSDRIHALILGATEGAAALGTVTAPSAKIARTFGPVTDLPVAPDAEKDDATRWELLLGQRDALQEDLRRARDALEGLAARIADVTKPAAAPEQKSRPIQDRRR